jgi:predicted RNA methylase
MSATNRGAERKKADFYPTPIEVIDNFLNACQLETDEFKDCLKILEPCAGNGNIIQSLKSHGYKQIDAIEIRPEESETLKSYNIDNVIIGDFLKLDITKKYHVIITNPPFSLAREFIEKSFDLITDNGMVIMLLRIGFLESKSRLDFWKKYPVTGLYVLSSRPSFTGKGTDASCYAWFVWDKSTYTQRIKVI